MKIEIEKNIPIPSNKYPFNDMEVGDSFAIDVDSSHNLRAAIHFYKKRCQEKKFITRSTDKEIRCWRVK